MPYPYSLTYRDFIHAQRLYLRHRLWSRIGFHFWVHVVPVLALLMGAWCIYAAATHQVYLLRSLLPAAAWLVFMSLWMPIMRIINLRRRYKRMIPPGEKGDVPVSFDFNEEGVSSTIPGRSEGRFYWSVIVDYVEDQKMALLFVHKKLFLYVPKRAMDEQAWASLRALITEKTGKQC
jgi:hypothetical protein